MLTSFDVSSGGIAIMQIPRDTYIEFEGEGMKINEILFLRDVYAIRDILEVTLCINIDYTALIDLEALEVVVDSVGGIEIDVPFDMKYSDPYQDLYIDLKAGLQVLDGKNATERMPQILFVFVRIMQTEILEELMRRNSFCHLFSEK